MGSKDSPSVVTGFKYMMGVHLIACHGPVDSVNKIIIGEREAWSGTQTTSGTITINKPDLFGGDGREGGVVGDVDILMGEGTQPRNTYLAAQQGPNCSGYRGLLSLVFKQFQWASGNPYFKSPWLEVTRVLAGWGDNGVWNAADAKIGTLDMNPAHMIYQAMTHPAWGMGYSPSDMNDAVMRACATKLKNENFGLSLEWDTQTSIEDFVANILEHISGSMGVNLSTGKFELKLIRDDYNINDLLELNESNILELRSFQRAAYGDSANEVVVTYTDREQNDKTIAVQDVASIAAQGAVISVTRNYPGIREASLAARVAMRDLKTLSTPLAKVNLTTNRVTWDKEKGDVVRLNWPDLQISGAAFRIIDIDKGTLTNGAINVTLVEDIFGLPDNAYSAAPISQWVDTVVPPIAVDAGKAFEVPYYEIVRSTSLANQATLLPDYGFGFFMASRGAVRSALNYVLASSPDNTTYSNAGVGHFSPAGSLVAPITAIQETITLTGAFDLNEAVLSADGGYAYIGNECVSVISVTPSTGVVAIKRGILDTVPSAHAAGVKVFFYSRDVVARDSTEHTDGETVYYKPRPTTGTGTLDLDDAQSVMLVMSNRASRPYPPGQFKVDGQYYPSSIAGPGVSISWAHRDRIAQTAGYIDYSAGNIGPEAGTTYRVRVYNGATLLRTYDLDATTTTWSYPADDDTADGNQGVLRITLNSVRDGLESLQAHDHTFNRIAASGSVTVGGVPAAPILTAADASFAVDLSWVFGNARTDMKHVEIRVATEPDLSHSDVLEYVNYPGLTKTHSLGIANSFRWYWCRVIDTSGSISPWSNMASGRGVTSAVSPTQMLADINALLQDGLGSSKIEMLADRFSVVAPDGSKRPFAIVESSPGVWKTLLDSEVLIGGNVDIANLNTGSLPSNVMMRLGGGTIELDGAGEIRVFKDLNPNPDFVKLSAGEIRFLRYVGGAYQTYNYLSRMETGIANNNDTVVIPGYWKAQPRVIVSPASLGLYKAANSAQDQSVDCQALSLQETFTGSGVWQFNARATLNLAAGTSVTAINATSGDLTATTTWNSGTYVTPTNCSNIIPTVNLTSMRWTAGTTYQNRSVNWRVRYTGDGGGGAWRTKDLSGIVTSVVDSYTFNFPAAGQYSFWIEFSASDVAGTFIASGASYESTTASINGTGAASNNGIRRTITMPAYSPPVGWQISSVNWSYNVGWYITGGFVVRSGLGIAAGPPGPGVTLNNQGGNTASALSMSTYTSVQPTYDNTQCWIEAYDTKGGAWGGGSSIYTGFGATGTASAVVTLRRYLGYTASGQNRFDFTSYGYTLASASVLATGTLNWLAVGE